MARYSLMVFDCDQIMCCLHFLVYEVLILKDVVTSLRLLWFRKFVAIMVHDQTSCLHQGRRLWWLKL